MTEILFYRLSGQSLDRTLPALLEKSLERGWRAVVQAASEERVEALDAHLWTFRDESFLPHGTWREPAASEQPILLTVQDDNPNQADVRFLIEGASLPKNLAAYRRVIVLFDGEDADALKDARMHWDACKALGLDVTCWQADARGRWQRMDYIGAQGANLQA
jgi:DNA polymerase-3 subunit chi